ncbi:thiamine diphosphokinase [Nitriliruptoraceae bacterium ZYF776]|nr:thiamine diphosphokinase [Profundirhabdus halotolerans]
MGNASGGRWRVTTVPPSLLQLTPGAHVVVLAGGAPVPAELAASLPPTDAVLAADGGLHLAQTLGLRVDAVVGDLDSVDPDLLAAAEAAGTRTDRHPVDKDRTDLAIALDAAVASGAGAITVVGGTGGRLDHLVANALLLAAPAYAEVTVQLRAGDGTVTVVHDRMTLHGQPGDLVSLLPVHGRVEGVTTEGLRFPLDGEPLGPGSSRGVSNRFAAPTATVRLTAGTLLAVQPATAPPPTETRTTP